MLIPVKDFPREMVLVGAKAIANGPTKSVSLMKVSNLFLIISSILDKEI